MSNFLTFIERIFGIETTPTTVAGQTTAESLYNSLLDEEKTAATWVSGALAIINQNITIDAPLISPIIESVFPNVDPTVIENTLVALAAKITTVQSEIPTTLEGAITAIQQYLIPKQGNDWIIAIQGLFATAVTIASPGTIVQKVVAVGEYIFQDIITPLLGLHKSTPVVASVVAPAAVTATNAGQPLSNVAPVPNGAVTS